MGYKQYFALKTKTFTLPKMKNYSGSCRLRRGRFGKSAREQELKTLDLKYNML